MPLENKNTFLDAGDSEDDASQGYNSEEEQLQKGGRSAKRRKLSEEAVSDADGLDAGSDEDDDVDALEPARIPTAPSDETKPRSKTKSEPPQLSDVSRPLTKKNLVATEAAAKKSGLVYISRVPPFMKPSKLRQLLEPYGKINRIFLSPEDPQVHSRRVKQGGNKKKMYTDGWIEFLRKADAKKVVDLLNARTIGGKKGSFYRDDIWSLVYLKGFKWSDLTAQIAHENAERTSRMQAEISKTTRENKEFVRNIEKAKMLDGIQSKAAAKRSRDEADLEQDGSSLAPTPDDSNQPKSLRKFKQATVKKRDVKKAPEEAKRVLSRLF
ncbi:Pre-rRNA-processing protein ESF2 [Xylariomycetidae sp. FL2044]|nr:Pre-rRNA-processing protein ESF2 [Xylariomycetidae sp. FL2044]